MSSPPARATAKEGPVLLIGVGGMLHRAWAALLDAEGVTHVDPGLEALDLTRPETLAALPLSRGQLVVNCAGYTDVDRAEGEEAAADAVNAEGTGRLARRCAEAGALLVHYSTDYVFDGRSRRPYRPDDPPAPLNAYGRGKLRGEGLLVASGCAHLLVRTSGLYAPWGRSFVRTVLELADARPSLRVVADQTMRPTSVEGLARASLALLRAGASGTLHLTDGGEPCTWFELAGEVLRLAGSRCRVEPCTAAEFGRPAPRPAYSVLDISGAERFAGPQPDWRSAVAGVVGRLRTAAGGGRP